jgi:glycosyltransferase involved in cell wall biosynthesis
VNILHLMSCRGWSSDAYWAATVTAALGRAGHAATLVCKRGSEARVIDRARESGVGRIETLAFRGGIKPATDVADLRRLVRWLPDADVVHVHRGKEHWLAAAANRLSATPRPIFRTRHIIQPVRTHALNRWLYSTATHRVITVTEAIRRQYVASGLVAPERVEALPGGVDLERFHPGIPATAMPARVRDGVPVIGCASGLRVMKGHMVIVEAAAELARRGRSFHLVLIGRGSMEARVRAAITAAGLGDRVSLLGHVPDLRSAVAAFDVALYTPLESDGMSRALFEYLAMARPVVASRVGVVPEVLEDGRTAVTVPAGEARPLADAIERLLSDPPLRSRIGIAGAALCESRLSSACVAARLAALYRGAASGARGAAA